MSLSLNLYLVSADEINPVFGSKDRGLVDAITTGMPLRVRSLDEWAARDYDGQRDEDEEEDEEDDAGDEEERLTIEQALGQIVDGRLTTSHFGVYASAWELVCAHLGESLPEQWAVRRGWVEPFDEWLERAGLPIRISDLVDSPEPPFPLPENPYLGMTVGHWTPAAIAQTRLLLGTTAAAARPEDASDADTLDAIKRWLASAEQVPKAMIVGFCY